ncbi:MAG TPA: ketopantoate reductase family protein [Conexibacter sp.]|nr:ketopantoate reductase family protein [Conexibacter sp.]
MRPFAILGPGGVGGFLAGALARADEDVVVVARERTAAAIARDGVHVQSTELGDFTARPATTARLVEPVATLLVATKAAALEQALERIDAEPQLVVPLLNGLDHMALLRERFGARVVVGTIRIEADRTAPGRVVHTSRFMHVELASDDAALLPRLDALAARLSAAGVPTRVGAGEAQVLWGKLVRLNTLACMTSAYDLRLGAIRADPALHAQLDACVEEGAAVARAEGAEIDPDRVRGELERVHAEFGSSMQRDIAAGRAPELDAIAGAVLRAGARHGVPCPTIAALAERVAARAGVPVPVLGR